MSTTGDIDVFGDFLDAIQRLQYRAESEDHSAVMDSIANVASAVDATDLKHDQRIFLKLMLSSAMIDTAADAQRVEGLIIGSQWAASILADESTLPAIAPQARFNLANSLLELEAFQDRRDLGEGLISCDPEYRLANLATRQQIRAMFTSVGNDPDAPPEVRSRALCNLGNVFDESGRWVEAYAVYCDALVEDPTNGNAAGNIAELLRRRLTRPTGHRGHLAAVYNHYTALAQSLGDRTAEIAGAAAAQRWNELEQIQTDGHLSHDGDPLDPYQQWIVEHRLALVEVLEGLGSDSPRWDSATVSSVVTTVDTTSVPRIFAAFNVLKSEFLVARRLAFTGISMIQESGFQQHPKDTGLYSDTLDGGFYGEGPAMLLLAQRSALDVLDKIAVTANEHFQSGMLPKDATFLSYWITPKTHEPRPVLPVGDPGRLSVLALAELATDTQGEGIYAASRLLRHAGTHRLVHVTSGQATGPTKDTFSSVDVEELVQATISALWVARAAYLYLVDLVESQVPTGSVIAAQVPNQR